MTSVRPYSALAGVYDAVMAHVDYEGWADYLLHITEELCDTLPSPTHVLELGAGTGLLTEALLDQSDWHLTVTDGSADMLSAARVRLAALGERTAFEHIDFSQPWKAAGAPFDAQLLLYDGFNYLMHPDQVGALFEGVGTAGKPGSLFLFDQSTPHNSINNADFFEDEGNDGTLRYHRKSLFDATTGIHTTTFEIEGPEGRFTETHRQRAWTLGQVEELLARHRFEILDAFDGFSLDPAHDGSERIHWLVRIPHR